MMRSRLKRKRGVSAVAGQVRWTIFTLGTRAAQGSAIQAIADREKASKLRSELAKDVDRCD